MELAIAKDYIMNISTQEIYIGTSLLGANRVNMIPESVFTITDSFMDSCKHFYKYEDTVIGKSDFGVIHIGVFSFTRNNFLKSYDVEISPEIAYRVYESFKSQLLLRSYGEYYNVDFFGLKINGTVESTRIQGIPIGNISSEDFKSRLKSHIGSSSKYYMLEGRVYLVNDDYTVRLWGSGSYTKLPYMIVPEDAIKVSEKEYLIAVDKVI